MPITTQQIDYSELAQKIKEWGKSLGFQQVSITDTELAETGDRLNQWLQQGYQGDMQWMSEHGEKRYNPEQLLPGTQRVITVRMDYLPDQSNMIAVLKDEDKAYISRYALGRDYHKLIRNRLKTLAKEIEKAVPDSIIQRPFVDSCPRHGKTIGRESWAWLGRQTYLGHKQ